MSRFLPSLNSFFEGLPDRLRRWRVLLAILLVGLTALAVAGLPGLSLDNSVDAFFPDDEPVKEAYDRFRVTFGSDEILYVVYRARDGDVFSEDSMRALAGVHSDLERAGIDRITDIDSLIDASLLEADGDTLVSRDFIGTDLPTSPEETERIAAQALAHPDYPRLFVSEDRQYASILIRTDFNARVVQTEPTPASSAEIADFSFEPETSGGELPELETTMMEEYVPVVSAVRSITEKSEYADQLEFHFSGNPSFMSFIVEVVMAEMGLIIGGSLLLIMLVLAVLFRSAPAVLWPMLLVVTTVLWTLGSIGWSGIPVGDTINIVIFLLIAVGVADSVHILSGYVFFRREGREHPDALSAVFAKSGLACLLTSVTTAAGLLAMTAVPIVTMQRFGVFAALGVLYAFVLTVVALPLLLDLWAPMRNPGPPVERRSLWVQRRLDELLSFSLARPRGIVAVFAVGGVFLLGGFALIQVDSNTITIFRESEPIRIASTLADENLAGTSNLEVLVDTGIPDGIKDPEVLTAIDAFQRQVEFRFPGTVRKTLSLANATKDTYRALNEGKQAFYRIPSEPQVLAQALVLFDGANPEDRRLFVTDDYQIARITVSTRNLGSTETAQFMADLTEVADAELAHLGKRYPDFAVSFTGQIPLFLKMMGDLSWSQLKSFAVSLGMISLILLVVFGSVRLGAISLAPNLLPIVSVFGVMGYLGIPLDLHTLLVIPIIIGISVDDTIHFLTHFRTDYGRTGDVQESLRAAMSEAGQAIVFTSLVLAVGYLIFLGSSNLGFAYFGFVSSIAIIAAAAADLVLLPALLLLVYPDATEEV